LRGSAADYDRPTAALEAIPRRCDRDLVRLVYRHPERKRA
jgi:hypothetical protein